MKIMLVYIGLLAIITVWYCIGLAAVKASNLNFREEARKEPWFILVPFGGPMNFIVTMVFWILAKTDEIRGFK